MSAVILPKCAAYVIPIQELRSARVSDPAETVDRRSPKDFLERHFVSLLSCLLIICALEARPVQAAAGSNRPNILFIYTDDNAEILPYYWNWSQMIKWKSYILNQHILVCPAFEGNSDPDSWDHYFAFSFGSEGHGSTGGYAINSVSSGQTTFFDPPFESPCSNVVLPFVPANFIHKKTSMATRADNTVWIVN